MSVNRPPFINLKKSNDKFKKIHSGFMSNDHININRIGNKADTFACGIEKELELLIEGLQKRFLSTNSHKSIISNRDEVRNE